ILVVFQQFTDVSRTDFFSLNMHQHPCTTLFPYTTLFRSHPCAPSLAGQGIGTAWKTASMICSGLIPLARASKVITRRCQCPDRRSEEHTSELQSRFDLVCRLLLEKKKVYENRL